MELVFTILFVVVFEFGPGPIVWLYNAEICNETANSVSVTINWTMVVIVSLITPVLFDNLNGYTFLVFAAPSAVSVIYIYFMMKETKGLSDWQIARLYRSDKA